MRNAGFRHVLKEKKHISLRLTVSGTHTIILRHNLPIEQMGYVSINSSTFWRLQWEIPFQAFKMKEFFTKKICVKFSNSFLSQFQF